MSKRRETSEVSEVSVCVRDLLRHTAEQNPQALPPQYLINEQISRLPRGLTLEQMVEILYQQALVDVG